MSYGGGISRSSSSSSSHVPSPPSVGTSSAPGAAPPLSSSSLFARPLPSHHRRPFINTPAFQRHSDAVEQPAEHPSSASSNGSASAPASQPAPSGTHLRSAAAAAVSPETNDELQQKQQQAQRRYYPHASATAPQMPAFARAPPLGPPPSAIRTSNFRELADRRGNQHQDPAGALQRTPYEAGHVSDEEMQQDGTNGGSGDAGESFKHGNGSGAHHLSAPAPPPTMQQIQQQHESQYSQQSHPTQAGAVPSSQTHVGAGHLLLQQLSQEALAQAELASQSTAAAPAPPPPSEPQPPVHPGSHGKVIRSNGGAGASNSPPGAASGSPDKGRRTRVPQACDLCRSRKARCLNGRPAGANNPTDPGQRCARCAKQNRDCTWSFFSNDGRQATTAKKRIRMTNGDLSPEPSAGTSSHQAGFSSKHQSSSSSKRHKSANSAARGPRGSDLDAMAQHYEDPYHGDAQSQHSQLFAVQLALQQRLRDQGSEEAYHGQPMAVAVDLPSMERRGSNSRRIISDGVERRRKRAGRASKSIKSFTGRVNMERRTRGKSALEKTPRRNKGKGKAKEDSTAQASDGQMSSGRSFTGPKDFKMTRRHSITTSTLADLAVLSFFEGNTAAKPTDQPLLYPFPTKAADRQHALKQDEARPSKSNEPTWPDELLPMELFCPDTPDSAPANAGDYGSLDDISPLTLQDCRDLNPGRSHIRLSNVLSNEPLEHMFTDAEIDAALQADGKLRAPFYPARAPRSKSRRHRSSRRREKPAFNRHVAHGQSRQIDLNALSQSQAAAGLLGINGGNEEVPPPSQQPAASQQPPPPQDGPRAIDSQFDSIFDMQAAMASQQTQRALEDGPLRSQSSVRVRAGSGEAGWVEATDPSYIVHLAQGGQPPTTSQTWLSASRSGDAIRSDAALTGSHARTQSHNDEYSVLIQNINELQKQHQQSSSSRAGPANTTPSRLPRSSRLAQIAIGKEGRAKVTDDGAMDRVLLPVSSSSSKKGQKGEFEEEEGTMKDLVPLLAAGGRKQVEGGKTMSMNMFAPQYQQQPQGQAAQGYGHQQHTPQAVALAVAGLPQGRGDGEDLTMMNEVESTTGGMPQGIDILAEVSSSQREMPPPS